MKRKIIIYTLILSTLLLSACSTKNTQTPNNTTQNNTTSSAENTTPSSDAALNNQQTQNNTTQNNNDTNMISEEEAKAIALDHAGLTSDQVTFVKSKLDQDNSKKHYEVEFYSHDNTEYDYEIDPYTGEILEYDHDAENYASSSGTTNNGTTNANVALSEAEAKKIALDKVAGATESDLRQFKLDNDDNRIQYEGTIIYDNTKYEFEIDANTGDVLKWDAEKINQ